MITEFTLASAAVTGCLGGIAVMVVTLAIEHFGGLVGGTIGSAPSHVVASSIGLWLQVSDPLSYADVLDFQKSVLSLPPIAIVGILFLYLWQILPARIQAVWPKLSLPRFLLLMTSVSLGTWTVLAVLVFFLLRAIEASTESVDYAAAASVPGEGPSASDVALLLVRSPSYNPIFIVAVLSVLVQISFGAYASWSTLPAPKASKRVGAFVVLARGLVAGIVIFLAINLAALNSYVGGILVGFPSIFITSMISLWISQGSAVPMGAIGPLMLGSASISTYMVLTAFLFPVLGLPAGVAVAWAASVLGVSVPSYLFLRARVRRTSLAELLTRAAPLAPVGARNRNSLILI